jgi:hypothetical protein
MKFLMKVEIPTEAGNTALQSPDFGQKMQAALQEIGAEAAYFTAMNGRRGGYILVDMDDAAEMPAKAEPFFLWLNAAVEFLPIMRPEDLAKAGPAIGAAVRKWGG